MLGVRISSERFGIALAESKTLATDLMTSGNLDFLDMSLWDCFKEPQEEEFKGKTLIQHFCELDRGTTRLGVAGNLRTPQDVTKAMEEGVEHGNELVGKAKPHVENAMEEGVNHGNELVRSVKPHAKNAIDQGNTHVGNAKPFLQKLQEGVKNGDAHRGKKEIFSDLRLGKKELIFLVLLLPCIFIVCFVEAIKLFVNAALISQSFEFARDNYEAARLHLMLITQSFETVLGPVFLGMWKYLNRITVASFNYFLD